MGSPWSHVSQRWYRHHSTSPIRRNKPLKYESLKTIRGGQITNNGSNKGHNFMHCSFSCPIPLNRSILSQRKKYFKYVLKWSFSQLYQLFYNNFTQSILNRQTGSRVYYWGHWDNVLELTTWVKYITTWMYSEQTVFQWWHPHLINHLHTSRDFQRLTSWLSSANL